MRTHFYRLLSPIHNSYSLDMDVTSLQVWNITSLVNSLIIVHMRHAHPSQSPKAPWLQPAMASVGEFDADPRSLHVAGLLTLVLKHACVLTVWATWTPSRTRHRRHWFFDMPWTPCVLSHRLWTHLVFLFFIYLIHHVLLNCTYRE